MAEQQQQLDQMTMDPAALYREETFTDQRLGSIRRLTPVDGDGNTDPKRAVLFQGQTQVLTPAGALPLSFELEADNLKQAAEQFPQAAQAALERTMEELKEMQRESQSSIMVPGQGQAGDGGQGGMPGGGMPGGGLKLG